jgi:hypothetical protein
MDQHRMLRLWYMIHIIRLTQSAELYIFLLLLMFTLATCFGFFHLQASNAFMYRTGELL